MQLGQKLVLVVCSNPSHVRRVRDGLSESEFQLCIVRNASEAHPVLVGVRCDIAIIDYTLTDPGIAHLCEKIEKLGIGQIHLTANSPDSEALTTRALRGDNIERLRVPFGAKSLQECARTLLNRAPIADNAGRLRLGDFTFDASTYDAFWRGRALRLPPIEFKLLQIFLRSEGEVVSRQHIFEEMWPREAYEIGRLVDVHVSNLRRILAETVRGAKICSVKGIGYRLTFGSGGRRVKR